MKTYVLQRLLLGVPVLFGISLVVFAALRLAPGDPALVIAGLDADAATMDAIRREHGLDRPIHEQYLIYMGRLLQFDLGRSILTHLRVTDELSARIPVTVALAAGATVLGTILGVTLGVIAARFQRTWLDYAVMILALSWVSVPNYVVGVLLILLFAVTLGLLPSVGAGTPLHFVLPVVTAGAVGCGVLARQTRAAVLEVLGEDYIRTAHSKGLAPDRVLLGHALRNALLPIITVVGIVFGNLLAGTVIVETIFGIPGVGRLTVDRIHARDYPTVQGAVLFIASGYVFVNIVVDLAYLIADKRVRLK